MKIEASENDFKPITITLETRDELLQFFSACNHRKISNALPLFSEFHSELIKMDQAGYEEYWNKLEESLKE